MVYSNIKRKKYEEAKKRIKIGSIFVTRYERARIIGARALQVSLGAPILIPLKNVELDAISIAERELEEGILPLTIRRTLPSGEYQDVPLSWLILEK
ncbi:MAG: DNA-directed RNA polymerase subunit K [Candidatus Lokiarchaeota archaeon]|nr:DNA-directed RNA polymerase subunit K [Candidatus Lokiarchaeota archaeon]